MANVGLGVATGIQDLISQQQLGGAGGTDVDTARTLVEQQPERIPTAEEELLEPGGISGQGRRRGRGGRGGIPTFKDDPLGAIGLILTTFSAGFRGDDLPSIELEKQAREEEILRTKNQIERTDAYTSTLLKGVDIVKSELGSDQKAAALASMGKNLEATLPGITIDLNELLNNPEAAADTAALREIYPGFALAAKGDDEFFKTLVENTDNHEAFWKSNDIKKRGELAKRIPDIIQFAQDNTIRMETVDDIFAVNSRLPEPLDALALKALQRQPEIAGAFGLKTQEQLKQEPKVKKRSKVVSGDSILGKKLGIPAGENARVEFTENDDGTSSASVEGRFGAATTTIQVGASEVETEFQKARGKGAGEKMVDFIDRGDAAVTATQNLEQMADLLTEIAAAPDTEGVVQTGSLQPLITSLQGFAADLGIDIDKSANSIGIKNVGDLSKKEDFNRLSRQITIDLFVNFKGNLNKEEVRIAEDAVANIGVSEDANISAIAAGLAAAQIARDVGIAAGDTKTTAEANAVTKRRLSNDAAKFKKLKKQFEDQIRRKTPAEELPEGLPEGAKHTANTKDGKKIFTAPDGEQFIVE